jgi:hypothetical protein
MEKLQLREKEIFNILNSIKNNNFVVIGGYAVNAYTMPRFSVDCDIVIRDIKELNKIEECLFNYGYKKVKNNLKDVSYGNFERYEKEILQDFKVSMDILIGGVIDRQTNAKFSANWIFDNSKLRKLLGKTINEELNLNIINLEALFVMKLISCRLTDIRDIFFLVGSVKDKGWIKEEISKRYEFEDRFSKLTKEIDSKQFKDNLQGVFGLVDNKLFEKHKKMIHELANDLF